MRSKEHEDIIKELDAAPEFTTPKELQTFLGCSDEALRELAEAFVRLCEVKENWHKNEVADWTLYPKPESFRVDYCREAEAINKILQDYDADAFFDVPGNHWIFLERYSRPRVGDETIEGSKAFQRYLENVPYVTATYNLQEESEATSRFRRYAELGIDYDANDEDDEPDDDFGSFSDEEVQNGNSEKKNEEINEENEEEDEDDTENHRDAIIVYDTRFRVKRSVFASAFLRVAQCVVKNSANPEERCVRVSVDVTGIAISARDGDFCVMERIDDPRDFRVLHYGSFLADPSDFMKIFSEPSGENDEELLFVLNFHFLTIKTARFRYRLFIEDGITPEVHVFSRFADVDPGDKLPRYVTELPELSEEQGFFEMESKALRKMVRRALLACTPGLKRSLQPRVAFGVGRRFFTLFAADRYTSTLQRGQIWRATRKNESVGQFGDMNRKSLGWLERFLSDSGYVQLACSPGRLRVRTGDVYLEIPTTPELFNVLEHFWDEPKRLSNTGVFFAGDLVSALNCMIGDGSWPGSMNRMEVTLEARNKRLVLSRGRRAVFPPLVEIPLKYCGNRFHVVLDAKRLYAFVQELPPETSVRFGVCASSITLFETRDGLKFTLNDLTGSSAGND